MKKDVFYVNYQNCQINKYNAYMFYYDSKKELICLENEKTKMFIDFDELRQIYQFVNSEINAVGAGIPRYIKVDEKFNLYKKYDDFVDVSKAIKTIKTANTTKLPKPRKILIERNITLRDMSLKEYREFVDLGYAFAPLLEDLANIYFKNTSDDIQNEEWEILKSIMKDEILDKEYKLFLYEKNEE